MFCGVTEAVGGGDGREAVIVGDAEVVGADRGVAAGEKGSPEEGRRAILSVPACLHVA